MIETVIPKQSAIGADIAANLFADSLGSSLSNYSQKQDKHGKYPRYTQMLPASPSFCDFRPAEFSDTGDVQLLFSNFNYAISAPIIDISASDDRQQIVIKAQPEESVHIFCELTGTQNINGGKLVIQKVTFYIDVLMDTPRANFGAATLQVLLWLSPPIQVRIPELKFDMELSFEAPLELISRYLRRRQIAYQLMVLEQAFDRAFLLPVLSGEDEEKVAFAYHAITDRSVIRPFHQYSFPVQADEKLHTLIETGEIFPYQLLVKHFDIDLFGQSLPFGAVILTIEKAQIVNPDDARAEVAQRDNHQFLIRLRSMNAAIRYDFTDLPRLTDTVWDAQTAELIALEDKLDAQFFQLGNRLAAATLADLNDEEKAAITRRFDLSEEAFADPDAQLED